MPVCDTVRFAPEHPLFADHFPGAPRVPGTLVVRALAEAAARHFGVRVCGVKRFRFRRFVLPGEYGCTLAYDAEARLVRAALLDTAGRPLAEGTLHV